MVIAPATTNLYRDSHIFLSVFFGLKANPYKRNAIPSSPIGFRNLITFWRLSCAFFFARSVNFLWNEWRKIMRSGDVSNFSNKKSWGEELKMSCWSSFRFLRFQEITITETVNFLRISFTYFFRWSLWRFFMARRWLFCWRNLIAHSRHSLTTWTQIWNFKPLHTSPPTPIRPEVFTIFPTWSKVDGKNLCFNIQSLSIELNFFPLDVKVYPLHPLQTIPCVPYGPKSKYFSLWQIQRMCVGFVCF